MAAFSAGSSLWMRARQSFVNSSDEILRLPSAAAASLSVHSSGSLDVPICAAASVAPASKLRRLKLGKRQIQILNGFVDLGRVLVADRHAIDARLVERVSHRRLPVFALR